LTLHDPTDGVENIVDGGLEGSGHIKSSALGYLLLGEHVGEKFNGGLEFGRGGALDGKDGRVVALFWELGLRELDFAILVVLWKLDFREFYLAIFVFRKLNLGELD
jgi:hypothetical protein